MDLFCIGWTIAFFILTGGLLKLCEGLMGGNRK